MILIWGFKARSTTLSEGSFHCPTEGGDRPFRHRSARRWFTLFFIPIIPLKELGEYVECTSCQSTFHTDVLRSPTTAHIEDVLTTALRHVVVSMVKADGAIDPKERQVAIEVMGQFSNRPYAEADLQHDLDALDVGSLEDQLEEVGGILNEHGKEALLAACVRLAGADGSVDSEELEVVERAGHALSMSRAHVRGVVDTTRERLDL